MVSHAHWKMARDRKVAQGIAEDPATEKLRAAIALRYDVGQAVHDRRAECGISQTELARRAGMTQPQLSKLEIGGTLPTVALLARLARAMDATFSLEADGEGFRMAFTAAGSSDAGPSVSAAVEATDTDAKRTAAG
ncbi:helix-turn-helix transcriptional regulator [Streptomyces sp. NPDC000341]|uniref:helix-turn-helix domain-containing protein n=1 Tax=Streptomyces sp. NPDC000341 TaxID=3156645 RepID=UPI00332BB68F